MLQSLPVFIFANQAGLDMLETTLVALQDITLDKIFDESGRKALCTDFAKLMEQVKLIITKFSSYNCTFHLENDLNFGPFVYSAFRVLHICQLESACRRWGGMCRMIKPLHGKYSPEKTTLFTAWLSLS